MQQNCLPLPGHSTRLQYSDSKSGPSQGLPPYWGSTQVLLRFLVPLPHETEQSSHSDQFIQTPSTEIKMQMASTELSVT